MSEQILPKITKGLWFYGLAGSGKHLLHHMFAH